MPPDHDDTIDRFIIVCPGCDRQLAARPEWVGREVRCPHCAAPLSVPRRAADNQPVRATLVQSPGGQHFNFGCPRCQSLLETQSELCGQTGRCPTCAARFVIPHLDPLTNVPLRAALLDHDPQDPTPLHAYAASGHQAPLIRRQGDGTLLIECPRCGTRGAITANNCPGCGVPFTMEGVPVATPTAGGGLAVAAFVLGILSIPLFVAVIFGPLALALGTASWLRRGSVRPSILAIVGMVLGGASLVLLLLAR